MAKTAGSVILIILLSTLSFAQQYVTVSASPQKKDFFPSENIRINVKADIQSGYHINANQVSDPDLIPTTIDIDAGSLKVGKISWPGSHKFKFSFSETELDVYEGSINIGVNLKAPKDIKPGKYDITGNLNYQACNDRACFSPKDAPFNVTVVIKEDTAKADTTKTEIPKDTTKKTDTVDNSQKKDTTTKTQLTENKRDSSQTITSVENKNQISQYIEKNGMFVALLIIFVLGIGLNLTPCVYPLIPITISYFGAQVSNSKGGKILMALFYVLGMSVTYSVLGVVAALTGGVFGSLLQSPIVVGILVLIFIALALSMFGVYEIKIPQSLANFSGKNRQGYFGTFLMGLTVGFIAAPCIGPLVLSLLVYVGQIGSPFLGFIMFFVLSLGLGLPYIFLALFSSSITKLPRSGEWMEGVKIIFGLMMLGLALYTAQPLMSPKLYEIIFPLFLILAGIYLILIDRKAITSTTYTRIKYIIAIAAIIWGAMNLHFGEEQVSGSGKYEWQMLLTQAQIDLSVGKSTDKPTIIDFYADWCAQCKELDKYTYINPKVIELSKKFNNIKVDLTKGDKDIEGKFKIQGLPVVAFLDKNGKEMEDLRITGFLKPDEFVKVMDKALNR
ncbi:MAG: protein-disulfide reductase DsbD [Ignavibacteria bacterium]|nr:protein-disulfide reductase DsbD [Ignavibacteria bacterium]